MAIKLMPTTVGDYPSMLGNLSFAFLGQSVAWFYVARLNIPPIKDTFESLAAQLPSGMEVFGLTPIDAVPIIVAYIFALILQSFKLHDLLSDIFKIRKNFDIEHILIPTALLVSATVDRLRLSRIRASRELLMADAFYKYASSTDPNPPVGKHEIVQSLSNWSWHWMALESQFLHIFVAIIFALSGLTTWALAAAFIALATGLVRQLYFRYAIRNAHRQIDTITADATRAKEIRTAIEKI